MCFNYEFTSVEPVTFREFRLGKQRNTIVLKYLDRTKITYLGNLVEKRSSRLTKITSYRLRL